MKTKFDLIMLIRYRIDDRLFLHNCSMNIDLNKENNGKELCTATDGYK